MIRTKWLPALVVAQLLSGCLAGQAIHPPTGEFLANKSGHERTDDNYQERSVVAQEDAARWARNMTVTSAILQIATILLIALTLLYTRRAAKAAAETVREARLATKSANRSADAAERSLRNNERPYIYIDIRKCKSIPEHSAQEGAGHYIYVALQHYGATPAEITQSVFRAEYLAAGTVPAPLNPRSVQGLGYPKGSIVAPNDEIPFMYLEQDKFSPHLAENVKHGTKIAWAYGYLRYADISGNNFITGYCVQFDAVRSDAHLSGGSEYNYFNEEKPSDIPPTMGIHRARVPSPH